LENLRGTIRFPANAVPRKWNALRFTECKLALSYKTGISVLNHNFKGDNLAKLIGMYLSETMVCVFYDPFDFRFAYALHNKNGEWIRLVNFEVTAATPAYFFTDAKRRKEERRWNKRIQKHPNIL
jgi:hypothetical protein